MIIIEVMGIIIDKILESFIYLINYLIGFTHKNAKLPFYLPFKTN